MGVNENYQELKKKINLFFDNELDSCDCNDLLSKVEDDPKCQSLFHKEKVFREYVKSNIKRPSVSTSLVTNIKNIIELE